MDQKLQYLKFEKETYVPLFSKTYWLDAACNADWNVWIYESGGNVLAAMPYNITSVNGFRVISRPVLTQNNGIIFSMFENQKNATRESNQERVISQATKYIKSLKIDLFEQQFHYSFTNWLPFYWEHYTCIVRYTYVIPTSKKTLNEVLNSFSYKTRNLVSNDNKNIMIVVIDPVQFYDFYEMIFSKQNVSPSICREQWEKLYTACAREGTIHLYAARLNCSIESVSCFVEDERSVYLLMGGTSTTTSSNNAYSRLIWKGIEYAHSVNKDFDFEGSVIKQVTRSIRTYGGIAKPYFRIRKIFNEKLLEDEFLLCREQTRKEREN